MRKIFIRTVVVLLVIFLSVQLLKVGAGSFFAGKMSQSSAYSQDVGGDTEGEDDNGAIEGAESDESDAVEKDEDVDETDEKDEDVEGEDVAHNEPDTGLDLAEDENDSELNRAEVGDITEDGLDMDAEDDTGDIESLDVESGNGEGDVGKTADETKDEYVIVEEIKVTYYQDNDYYDLYIKGYIHTDIDDGTVELRISEYADISTINVIPYQGQGKYMFEETLTISGELDEGKDVYEILVIFEEIESELLPFSLWRLPKPLAYPLPEEAGKPSNPITVKLTMPEGGPADVNLYYTLDRNISNLKEYPEAGIEVSSALEPLFAVAEKDGVYSETAEHYYSFSYEDCFIATAAYGSPLEPSVAELRQFRDRYLLTNYPGQLFVQIYYRFSPPIACIISENEVLKAAVRVLLQPLVCLVSSLN